jgi:hypothetical protein
MAALITKWKSPSVMQVRGRAKNCKMGRTTAFRIARMNANTAAELRSVTPIWLGKK